MNRRFTHWLLHACYIICLSVHGLCLRKRNLGFLQIGFVHLDAQLCHVLGKRGRERNMELDFAGFVRCYTVAPAHTYDFICVASRLLWSYQHFAYDTSIDINVRLGDLVKTNRSTLHPSSLFYFHIKFLHDDLIVL